MSIESFLPSTGDLTQHAPIGGPGVGRCSCSLRGLLRLLLLVPQSHSLLVALSLDVVLVGLTARTGYLQEGKQVRGGEVDNFVKL